MANQGQYVYKHAVPRMYTSLTDAAKIPTNVWYPTKKHQNSKQ